MVSRRKQYEGNKVMAQKQLDYFIDTEDEEMYLEMMHNMSFEEAENIYTESKDDLAGTHLSNTARKLTFEFMSYKNLRYLIIGCERAGAELRVKALATFLYRASLTTRLAPLVSNERLHKMLETSLKRNMETIYEWSKVEYKGQ